MTNIKHDCNTNVAFGQRSQSNYVRSSNNTNIDSQMLCCNQGALQSTQFGSNAKNMAKYKRYKTKCK